MKVERWCMRGIGGGGEEEAGVEGKGKENREQSSRGTAQYEILTPFAEVPEEHGGCCHDETYQRILLKVTSLDICAIISSS